jgi:hypothetical protein
VGKYIDKPFYISDQQFSRLCTRGKLRSEVVENLNDQNACASTRTAEEYLDVSLKNVINIVCFGDRVSFQY